VYYDGDDGDDDENLPHLLLGVGDTAADSERRPAVQRAAVCDSVEPEPS